MKTYLRLGNDTLDEARRYRTQAAAIRAYRATAEELARYGQTIEATLHGAHGDGHAWEIVEYPDYVLTLGPRGGVHLTRA